MTKMANAITGALFGVAVGDALGAPLEFMSAEEIERRYGKVKKMIGGGWLSVKPGEVTDDTQMTLAVASAIARHPAEPEPWAGQNFIEWAKGGPKDIGGTCRMAITAAMDMIKNKPAWENCEKPADYNLWAVASKLTAKNNGNRSAGNGALMRTVYPGLYYPDKKRAVDVAARIGRMTHWDDLSEEACVLYTDMLNSLIKNCDSTLEKRRDQMEYWLIGTQYQPRVNPDLLNPSGFVVDSLKCALHSIRSTDTFEDAIITAVNMGGDADTIGAITGGLAGALYGFYSIPCWWSSRLEENVRNEMLDLASSAVMAHGVATIVGAGAGSGRAEDIMEYIRSIAETVTQDSERLRGLKEQKAEWHTGEN